MTDAVMTYCGHCGETVESRDHAGCLERLRMEPPRYCTQCRRRMVVQVVPAGWTARCVDHGLVTGVRHG